MPKKALVSLTEPMFYVLLALSVNAMCGIEISSFIEKTTDSKLKIGPATLYTIFAKFEKEKYIKEMNTEGRKRTYQITAKGLKAYQNEIERLKRCLRDVSRIEGMYRV